MRHGLLILAAGVLVLAPAAGQQAQEQRPKEQAGVKARATLRGHASDIYAVAFSPDGKTLASGSGDGTVKLWEVATGKERATLKGHTNLVWAVAFSPDGKTLASANYDRTVKLWEVATGKERATLRGHTSFVWSVAFSPDGKTLASGSSDGSVKLWEVVTARERASLQGRSSVESVAYSPDGKTLAVGSANLPRPARAEPARCGLSAASGPCQLVRDGRARIGFGPAAGVPWRISRAAQGRHPGRRTAQSSYRRCRACCSLVLSSCS
jgi:Tol biopolymer transport system component